MWKLSSEEMAKYLTTGVLAGTLVLLSGVGWLTWMVDTGSVTRDAKGGLGQSPVADIEGPKTVIEVDDIDGMERVNKAIAKSGMPKSTKGQSRVRAAVLPQHALAADTLANHWKDLAEKTDPEVIYIVGPAHWNQGNGKLQTMRGVFKTAFGVVETGDQAVNALIDEGVVSHEPASFSEEHAVGVHMPFIAAYFPDAKVVPVLGKSYTGDAEARALLAGLADMQNGLLISSLDFSHYERSEEADDRDAETITYFDEMNTSHIDTLSSAYLDSPFAANAFLRFSRTQGCQTDLVWRDDSGRMFHQEARATTSYMIWHCIDGVVDREITLNAVGDVMLSRGVGEVLVRKDGLQQLAPIVQSLAEADMTFVNLESVVSDIDRECAKKYCFKADPETAMPVLKQFGTTHASVINNHNSDYSRVAWEDSVTRLEQAKITPVGGYRNDSGMRVTEHDGTTFAWLGFDTTRFALPVADLQDAVRKADVAADHVIISFHWGIEYQHQPSSAQRRLARASIDAGADVVLGHHPHVLQGVERYKNGLIAYSLGNFVFDQSGADRSESVIARIGFADSGGALILTPVRIEEFLPRMANPKEAQDTLSRIAEWSSEDMADDLRDGHIEWGGG
jgi:poly-gamma-glutamate synthesis protein (capsule biosynthesis protein)